MLNFTEVFGAFENFKKVILRCNPRYLSIVNFSPEKESDDIWKSELLGKEQTLRYVLVQLIEERLGSFQIFGGKDPYASFAALLIRGDDIKDEPPMKNPPRNAVKGKGWEKASYIVRFSSDNTHLGIAGSIMEKLAEKVPNCTLCLEQSGHGEPAKIVKTTQFYDYATVVGAGFAKVDPEKKRLILYGRSRAFTINYKSQIVSYLGMTGHEFVALMLQSELPEGWSIDVINNDVEVSITDEREIIPSPE